MTLLMVWNIEKFSLPKIFNANNTVPHGAVRSPQAEAQDRLQIIRDGVLRVNPPDVFAVIEVVGKTNNVIAPGTVPPQGSPATTAVLRLLADLQAIYAGVPGAPRYRVVPPIMSGDQGFREGIAVFYNSTNLRFVGPWIWATNPALQVGQSQAPVAGLVARPYAGPWVNALPAAQNQNTFAGQWQFNDAAGNPLAFPNNYNRSPFLTQFIDLTAGNRNLYLYWIHTSPRGTQPRLATGTLATIGFTPLGLNDVTVIAGDFNLDSFLLGDWAAYNALRAAPRNFRCLLDPTACQASVNPNHCIPYFSSHFLKTREATPYRPGANPSATQNFYPRYGYMGKSPTSTKSGAIDNIFVQYNPGNPAVPANAAALVNPVAGAPYINVQPLPPGAPPAPVLANAYQTALAGGVAAGGALPLPVPPGAAGDGGYPPAAVPPPDPNVTNFRNWTNFGKIRSTSDHLAIVATI